MANADVDRVLPLYGIFNFRDYGGYPAANGMRVKRATLWRSGQHAQAGEAELAAVSRLGLRTVIDLRGDSERELYPCVRPADFVAAVLFAPGETAGLAAAAAHEEASQALRSVEGTRLAMIRMYSHLPERPVLIGSLRMYFEALAEREGPSLLHCLAGKDRTGVAVALAHHLLGVHPDDVLADYLLTNTAFGVEQWMAGQIAAMRRGVGEGLDDDAIRVMLSVRPEYLEAAFAAISEQHGSIDRYLEDVIEVTPARKAAIRAKLLE
jgi:protein-tyrosine phosphatase